MEESKTFDEQKAIDGLCEKYKSHLSFQQTAEGISVCLSNARSVYEDACLLFDAGRFARAMSLFICCMEELGKVAVLASMSRIPKNNQRLWKECWEDFRSHEQKATRAIVDTYPDESRSQPDLFFGAAVLQRSLAPLGERLRQFGLYVDYHSREKRWLTPGETTEEDADRWRKWAELALLRSECLYASGLYCAAALKIQNEVFGPLNASRPARKDLNHSDLQAIRASAHSKLLEYFRRLVDAGILDVASGVQVLGMPLADFLAMP